MSATVRGAPAQARWPALAGAVLAALALATFLAIFYAQELKRRPPLLKQPAGYGVITLEPGATVLPPHVHHYAHFDVRPTVGHQRLTVAIVSEATGRTVWSTSLRVREWHEVPLAWPGDTTAGAPAPPGRYRLRIHFQHPDTTVRSTVTLRLIGPSS